jgi:cephalosporin hydroxylase
MDRGRVLTIDVNNPPRRPAHPRIQYLTGSSTAEPSIAAVKSAAREATTVLVILDSDHSCQHVLDEMRIYADVVTSGSYLIVEDGIINGHPIFPEQIFPKFEPGPGPTEAIAQFMSERDDFMIDDECEKFLMTFNPRGYLKKIDRSATA